MLSPLRLDLATQVRFWTMHWQMASLGVGGKLVAACQVLVVGQAWGELDGEYEAELTPLGDTLAIAVERFS